MTPAAPTSATDQGRTCLVTTFVTVALWAIVGGILAACGVLPAKKTSDPAFVISVTLLSFAFISGQGAAVTGFIAMKQRDNPLWILPAIIGGLLGVAAVVGIIGLATASALAKAGVRF